MKKALVSLAAIAVAVALTGCATCGPCPGKKARCGADKDAAGCATKECVTKHCAAGQAVAPAAAGVNIGTDVLDALLRSGVPLTVLDARTGQYDDGKRIPGAKSLSPQATEAEALALIPNKEALVVTYCSNLKCPASKMLAENLHKLGFKNVLEYPHGIAGWIEAGHPVTAAQ